MTHHTTTQQEIIDIKGVFQSYYMKKYILIHFEIQKKLIVVGLFLLLAGFRGPQANFTGRSLKKICLTCGLLVALPQPQTSLLTAYLR